MIFNDRIDSINTAENFKTNSISSSVSSSSSAATSPGDENAPNKASLNRHSSVHTSKGDKSMTAHVSKRNTNNQNYISLSKRFTNYDAGRKSTSYSFNTFDPKNNRLSCYDNDVVSDYLTGKIDLQSSQDIIISSNGRETDLDENGGGIIPVYARRVSLQIPIEGIRPNNDYQKKGSHQTYELNSNSKAFSNNNLFARALNYAFKKTSAKKTDPGNATWKTKLSKYLNTNNTTATCPKPTTYTDNLKDDLSATYHLSRRNPIKQISNIEKNEHIVLGANTVVNPNPCVTNQPNSNHLLLCLSSSSSSSASNNSTSLSTPASFEAQNISLTGENNKHKNNSGKKAVTLNKSNTITKCQVASVSVKRSLSKSKSNSHKLYELTSKATSCVNNQASGKDLTDSYEASTNHTTNNKSNKMINNGFNSLRKMLKISSQSDSNKATLISKKSRNKCLSASATPLPSCLAPNQFGINNTDSQTSAYLSTKTKSNGKRKTSPSVSRAFSKLSLNRHQSVNSLSSTKSSKQSFNPSNFTKSIINQTNSSFSSTSLSSHSYTPTHKTIKPQQDNIISCKQPHNSLTNHSVSHTSLNSKPFQAITHNHSPDTPRKNKQNLNSTAYLLPNSSKEFKSEKCILTATTLPGHATNSSNNQKKMINMLKVYKNVLNKMQKTPDNSSSHKSPDMSKCQSRYSNEVSTSFSANKVIKPIVQYSAPAIKTSSIKVANHTEPTSVATINNNNSLKNANKKVKKLAKISPQEEIMCDLEVASYFDTNNYKDVENDEIYDTEDGYYFDEEKTEAAYLAIENENLEDDSKNLEVLVRQLAAEAALSTLNDSKQVNDAEYMKSFNDIFGKVNEQQHESSGQYLYKNRSFNNYDMSMKRKGNKPNYKHLYEDGNKQLVYDLIENELILNHEDYNLINQLNENLPTAVLNQNESFSDEFLNPGSDNDSISPPNYNHTSLAALNFNYTDEVDSLLKSEASSNYEIDSIENWLDSIQNNSIQEVKRKNSLKNGFMSLKFKPQRTSRKLTTNTVSQFIHGAYGQPKKRSSSSTSFQPACNFIKIIEKPVHNDHKQRVVRTNSITIDINDPSSTLSNVGNDNGQIKIEKKIRLNYARPHNYSSVLNFGTLC